MPASPLALVKSNDQKRIDLKVTGPSLYMRHIFLPRWFSGDISKTYRLTYVQARIDQVSMMAQASDIDFVVTHQPFDLGDWVPIHIFTEKIAVVGRFKKHPNTFRDLGGQQKRWIGYRAANEVLQEFFARNHTSSDLVDAYIDDVESILDIVRTNDGFLTLLPAHALRANEKLAHWIDPESSGQKLYLMYRMGRGAHSEAVKALRTLLGKP